MREFYEHLLLTLTASMSQPTFSWMWALGSIEIKQLWEIKGLLLPSCGILPSVRQYLICLPCLKIYSSKRIEIYKFVELDCIANFWAQCDGTVTLAKFAVLLPGCPSFFADGTVHLEANSISQFLYVPHDVRLFSLLNEKFALGLGLCRLGRWLWVQHLAAEDECNWN